MKLIVNVIFTFVSTLINLILLPLNVSIISLFPSLNDSLTQVNSLLDWLKTFTVWVVSWLPFNSSFYSFVLLALIFIYSVPLITNLIKLIVKWWHYLVP